jgi:DNA-binding CsgD family transcriptional regulator
MDTYPSEICFLLFFAMRAGRSIPLKAYTLEITLNIHNDAVNSVTILSQCLEDSANLIRAINGPDFGAALERFLYNAAEFDNFMTLAYNGENAPIELCRSDHQKASITSLAEYQSGAYLLDPFYQCLRRGIAPGVYRLKDLAPDHFFRSEYYRTYYRKTCVVDELGIFVPMSNGGMVVASIERENPSRPFGKKDIERINTIEPVVREAIGQHWRNPEIAEIARMPTDERYDTLPTRVRDAAAHNNRASVTNRESEVVSLILRGYSSISIGSMLEISVSTVKVHRKNIYAKLQISSQAELFSLFLPLLTRPAA